MPEYDTQPHVVAKIRVKVGGAPWFPFGPGDAATVKTEVAAWLRAYRSTKTSVKILVEIDQSSPDTTDKDGGTFKWVGDASHGLEYAAQWCERFPEWGRGR